MDMSPLELSYLERLELLYSSPESFELLHQGGIVRLGNVQVLLEVSYLFQVQFLDSIQLLNVGLSLLSLF